MRELQCVGVAVCVGVAACGSCSVWELRGMESQCVGVVGCWGLQFGEIAMWKVAVWAGCSVGRFFVGGSCGVGALQCGCIAG